MRLFNHEIEFRLRFRSAPWTKITVRKTYAGPYQMGRPYDRSWAWGKFVFSFGQPHLIPITVCAECGEAISGISSGDEGWSYCEGCQTVEGRTEEITMEEYEQRQG